MDLTVLTSTQRIYQSVKFYIIYTITYELQSHTAHCIEARQIAAALDKQMRLIYNILVTVMC